MLGSFLCSSTSISPCCRRDGLTSERTLLRAWGVLLPSLCSDQPDPPSSTMPVVAYLLEMPSWPSPRRTGVITADPVMPSVSWIAGLCYWAFRGDLSQPGAYNKAACETPWWGDARLAFFCAHCKTTLQFRMARSSLFSSFPLPQPPLCLRRLGRTIPRHLMVTERGGLGHFPVGTGVPAPVTSRTGTSMSQPAEGPGRPVAESLFAQHCTRPVPSNMPWLSGVHACVRLRWLQPLVGFPLWALQIFSRVVKWTHTLFFGAVGSPLSSWSAVDHRMPFLAWACLARTGRFLIPVPLVPPLSLRLFGGRIAGRVLISFG